MAITEKELIIPALELLNESPNGLTTSNLIILLRKKMNPTGRDIEILAGRNDDVFSQKVRNLISHKTIEKYISINNGKMIINKEGIRVLNDKYLSEQNELNNYSKENFDEDSDDYSAEIEKNDDFKEEYTDVPLDCNMSQLDNIYLSVSDLKRKYDRTQSGSSENALFLDPYYQRGAHIWSKNDQSLFIESIMLNIPIPSLYLAEDSKANLMVIDGRQRLQTIFDFIDGKFKLQGLPILRELNGYTFSQLTGEKSKYRSRIEDRSLHIAKLRYGTNEMFVIKTFERVNSKGAKLNPQEIRNAIHHGKATKLLDDISNHYNGVNQIIDKKRMKDKYIVLRYFAMQEYYDCLCDGINVVFKTISDYLSATMERINHQSDNYVKTLQRQFIENYDRAKSVFNKIAFRFDVNHPINMILFEMTLIIVNDLKTKTDKEILNTYLQYLKWNDIDNKDKETSFEKNIKYHRDSKENIEERLLFIKKLMRD